MQRSAELMVAKVSNSHHIITLILLIYMKGSFIVFTCFSVRALAFSLETPISHTHTAVLVPPVITSLGLGQMAHRI